jgi:hypothetical protein
MLINLIFNIYRKTCDIEKHWYEHVDYVDAKLMQLKWTKSELKWTNGGWRSIDNYRLCISIVLLDLFF